MSSRPARRAAAAGLAVLLAAAVVAVPQSAEAKKKPRYKVTVKVSATTVKTSHSFTISGKVKKRKAPRKKVLIQRHSGSAWVTVAKDKLDKKSRYAKSLPVGKTAGTFKYRVVKKKSKKARRGVSKVVSIRVVTWGTVKAWGADGEGELGDGGVANGTVVPVDVKGLTEVVELGTGNSSESAYARRLDGSVWAWGDNDYGQLGGGTVGVDRTVPGAVPGLTGVTQLAPTTAGISVLRWDGSVWSWGRNDYGQLGTGAAAVGVHATKPVRTPISGVTMLAGGYDTMYALKGDGTVWAWGLGDDYNLGQGAGTDDSAVPVKVAGLPAGIKSVTSVGYAAYALDGAGRVWAWGFNGNGELGNGVQDAGTGTPAVVPGLTGVTRVGPSAFGAPYALRSNGTVWSWGQGSNGKNGDVTGVDSPNAQQIGGLTGPRAFSGANSTGFALKPDGTVWWWGDGALSGSEGSDSGDAMRFPGLSRVSAIGGGAANGYAVIG